MLGPIVKYKSGPEAGQLVAPMSRRGSRRINNQGQPHLVAQWADNHNELAQGWVSANPTHAQTSLTGPRTIRARSTIGLSRIRDASAATIGPRRHVLREFLQDNPGKFPSSATKQLPNGKSNASACSQWSDVQSDSLRHVEAGPSLCFASRRACRHGDGVGVGPRPAYFSG